MTTPDFDTHHAERRGTTVLSSAPTARPPPYPLLEWLWSRFRVAIPCVVLGICGLIAQYEAEAATYDPDLTWRTIVTEHFRINFHQGEEQLAEEFSLMVEDVFDTMTAEMKWVPKGRTEVLLIDRTDQANGYASVVPYKKIVIYVTAPQEDSTLSLYEDWSEGIFTHELTHILHMDTNYGIVRAARYVVGTIVSTNDISPWWMIEGLATFQETRHTTGGRGRAPLVDMIIRTSVLEDDFPPLGNLDGLSPDPPAGNLRYLFGQDFIQYVADHQGRDVWTRWTHVYGSSLPYILPSKRVFGRLLVPLYFDWRTHLFETYGSLADHIRAEGIREGETISEDTPTSSCSAPSFAPDNQKLVWSCYDLQTGSAIWMSDAFGQDSEVILKDKGAKNFTWRSDSEAFVYAATHIVNRFNTWSDIYLHQLGTKNTKSLTSGARARDPDFSPDGRQLLMVTNKTQNNQLEVMTIDQRREALTDHTDHTQLSTPRWSPDGRAVALSVWKHGRRDLWLYSPEGVPLRRLTSDRWNDRDPEWSPDGRFLFFSSDRSGVPNIYAIDTRDEHLWQVTHVLTGAVHPSISADNKRIAYQQYSSNGWDIRLMPLDPETWIDRGTLAAPLDQNVSISDLSNLVERPVIADPETTARWGEDLPAVPWTRRGVPFTPKVAGVHQEPTDSIDTFDQSDVKDVFGEEEDYPFTIPPRRYNPLPALIPRYYLPYIQTTGLAPTAPFDFIPWGLQATLYTGTADPLVHYAYAATVNYRTDANFFGWSAAFTLNRWLPVFSIGGSGRAVYFGSVYVQDPETPVDADGNDVLLATEDIYWEQRTEGWFTVSYPYSHKTTIFANYTFTHRTELNPLREDAYLPAIPIRGTVGKLSAGWRYSWSQPTAYAISREDSRIFSLVAGFMSPYLGTSVLSDDGSRNPITQLQLTTELREYIVNPWVPNHVLAIRLAGGVALGGTDFFGNYALGGSFGDSAFYVTPDEFRMLRGYPIAADIGDMYWLTGAEYRFPIVRIDRGLGTLPAFLRVLSGAVYVDAGNAFTNPGNIGDAFDDSLVGVGAELSLSTMLGWNAFLTGRLGYGVGLTANGHGPTDPQSVYFELGGSF